MARRRQLMVANQETALYLGIALTIAGAMMLRDAFEDRGQPRPWLLKLIGLAT